MPFDFIPWTDEPLARERPFPRSPTLSRSYSYADKAGNITQRTDARGLVTNYDWDALNRLTAIEYLRNYVGCFLFENCFFYNNNREGEWQWFPVAQFHANNKREDIIAALEKDGC